VQLSRRLIFIIEGCKTDRPRAVKIQIAYPGIDQLKENNPLAMAVIYKKTLERKTQEIAKLREHLNDMQPEIKKQRSASRSGIARNLATEDQTSISQTKRLRPKSTEPTKTHKRSKSQSKFHVELIK